MNPKAIYTVTECHDRYLYTRGSTRAALLRAAIRQIPYGVNPESVTHLQIGEYAYSQDEIAKAVETEKQKA